MIKYLLLISLAVIAIHGAEDSKIRRCKASSDCNEDECCVQRQRFAPSCRKRVSPKGRCNSPHFYDADNLIYKGKCPCVAGYECEVKPLGKRKCKKVEEITGTTEEPEPETA